MEVYCRGKTPQFGPRTVLDAVKTNIPWLCPQSHHDFSVFQHTTLRYPDYVGGRIMLKKIVRNKIWWCGIDWCGLGKDKLRFLTDTVRNCQAPLQATNSLTSWRVLACQEGIRVGELHTYIYICVCVCVCVYIYTLVYRHTYTCINTYTYKHTCTHTYIHTHIPIHTFIHTHTHIHTHIHTYIYIHIYTHLHIHTYIYIYTHTYIYT